MLLQLLFLFYAFQLFDGISELCLCVFLLVEVSQRVAVDREVNRARCMPQNPSVVAAKTCNSEVYVFDFTKERGGSVREPDLRLRICLGLLVMTASVSCGTYHLRRL